MYNNEKQELEIAAKNEAMQIRSISTALRLSEQELKDALNSPKFGRRMNIGERLWLDNAHNPSAIRGLEPFLLKNRIGSVIILNPKRNLLQVTKHLQQLGYDINHLSPLEYSEDLDTLKKLVSAPKDRTLIVGSHRALRLVLRQKKIDTRQVKWF